MVGTSGGGENGPAVCVAVRVGTGVVPFIALGVPIRNPMVDGLEACTALLVGGRLDPVKGRQWGSGACL